MKTAIFAFFAAMIMAAAGSAYAQTNTETTVTPSVSPSITTTITPSPTMDGDQYQMEEGVGGSAGTTNTPQGAPNTGFGGAN